MKQSYNSQRPRIGFHAPIKGGLHQALIVAKETGCDTVQIFSRNPRGWAAKPLSRTDIALFKKVRRLTKLKPVVIHCKCRASLFAKRFSVHSCLVSTTWSFIRAVPGVLVKPTEYARAARVSSLPFAG